MAEERAPKVNHGPGGPRGPRGPRPKIEHPGRLLKRILGYTFKDYGLQWVVVLVCIVTTVFASLQGTLFMKTLIDDYIKPMLLQENPDFSPLAGAIGRVACFYLLGVIASFTQSRIMIYVTQGTMRNLRNDLFESIWNLCPSNILTPMPTAISCPFTPTILTPCAR